MEFKDFILSNVYSNSSNAQLPFEEDYDERIYVTFDVCKTDHEREVICNALSEIAANYEGATITVDPMLYYQEFSDEKPELDINELMVEDHLYHTIVDCAIGHATIIYYIKNSTDTLILPSVKSRLLDEADEKKLFEFNILYDKNIYAKHNLGKSINTLIVPTYDKESDILKDIITINTIAGKGEDNV